ncbi:MAG: sensor histidine kinase [Bacteroidota bacterium]
MSKVFIISATLVYLALLFGVAYWVESRKKLKDQWTNSPIIYALSLAVYCTAWTFFGSVGRAAEGGPGFLPIYLGPTLLAPIWIIILRKMVLISKHQRLTSVADFLSSRYGKSTLMGVIAVIVAVLGIIPYISIQLKAISLSYDLMLTSNPQNYQQNFDLPFYEDTAFYVTVLLAIFAILFGTRQLDPNERHTGLVASIAFESVFKLIAFLIIGAYITFGIFGGFGDLFGQAMQQAAIAELFTFSGQMDGTQWFWLMLVSMFAFLLLPRQFHVAVVENNSTKNINTASWLLPLYLLIINIFVVPIAVAGSLLLGGQDISSDTFVLSIPLLQGNEGLAFLAALGGFSAATGMVIVATVALSIMISNNLLLPLLIRSELADQHRAELPSRLLGIRRVSIIMVLLLSYTYFKSVGEGYSLVSIGLISFLAVAQFAPPLLAAMYWKGANKRGAILGLLTGVLIWAFCLPFPTLVKSGFFSDTILTEGLFGLSALRPEALLGLDFLDQFSHAAFWSLGLNTLVLVAVSLYSKADQAEIPQADIFVNIAKYTSGHEEFSVIRRVGKVADIEKVLARFLGGKRANYLLNRFERRRQISLQNQTIAPPELIDFAETQLAGALGAASAKTVVASITKADAISLEEMLTVLEQTQEIVEYNQQLEEQRNELEKLTQELRQANQQLQELDRLKAEFVSTVTHELRTPITSIKAFAKILADNPRLEPERKAEFLDVLVNESERISRLINQVLDLEKIQALDQSHKFVELDFHQIVLHTTRTFSQQVEKQQIEYQQELAEGTHRILGDEDRIIQVLVNLWSNAIKFSDPEEGKIRIETRVVDDNIELYFSNNGKQIPILDRQRIFDRFTQLQDNELGKPQGSGLGLYICQHILEQHNGSIKVDENPNWATSFRIQLPRRP